MIEKWFAHLKRGFTNADVSEHFGRLKELVTVENKKKIVYKIVLANREMKLQHTKDAKGFLFAWKFMDNY